MSDETSNGSGDALARLVATSLASLLVAAVLAAGAHLWALSESCADTRAHLAALQDSAAQLRDALGCDADSGDLHRICLRLERAEQRLDALTRAVRPEDHP
jgi:hypothetical protein